MLLPSSGRARTPRHRERRRVHDQHHRPGLGRQRGLGAHGRRRHLRRLPALVRHDVQRVLPATAAHPRRPHRAQPRLRLPRQARRRPVAGPVGQGDRRRLPGPGPALGRRPHQRRARPADRRRQGVHRQPLHPPQPRRPAGRAGDPRPVPHPRRAVRGAQDRRADPRRRPSARHPHRRRHGGPRRAPARHPRCRGRHRLVLGDHRGRRPRPGRRPGSPTSGDARAGPSSAPSSPSRWRSRPTSCCSSPTSCRAAPTPPGRSPPRTPPAPTTR